MNYFNHQNVQLAYEAVYNQDLCESMEDLGLIDDYDYLDEERKADKVARQQGSPRSSDEKREQRNTETGLPTSTREVLHQRRRNPHGRLGSYYHDLRMKLALGKYIDREGNPQFRGHYSRHPHAYDQDLRKYNRYLNRDESTPFGESYDLYDVILEYLIQEGYADTLGSAEIILENMSDEWIDSLIEAFVDPEEGENPSGRRPIDVVSEHPKKKVRTKAVRAMARQMEKEYGGKWRTRTSDPVSD